MVKGEQETLVEAEMAAKRSGFMGAVGSFFVPKMTRTAAAESAKELGSSLKYTFGAVRGLFRPPVRTPAPEDFPAGPAERFEFNAAREFLTEAKIASMLRSANRTCFILTMVTWGLAGAAFVETALLAWHHSGFFGYFRQAYSWLLMLAFGVMALRWAVISYQLETRRAVTFPEWLAERHAMNVLGKIGSRMMTSLGEQGHSSSDTPQVSKKPPVTARSSALRRLRRPLSLLLLAAGGTGLCIQKAAAQIVTTAAGAGAAATGFVNQLGSTDLSGQWLRILFPTGVTSGSGAGTDTLAAMFATFNSIMLDFGAGMLFWHGMTALVDVAHRGSAQSNNWHQIWSPIRVATGATFLFPVKGYCLAQLVAVQVLAGGYLMANSLWGSYVNVALNTNTLSNSVANLSSLPPSSVLNAVLSAETCQAYQNFEIASGQATGYVDTSSESGEVYLSGDFEQSAGVSMPWTNGTVSASNGRYTYVFGACGTLSIGQEGASNSLWNQFVAGGQGAGGNETAGAGDAVYSTAVKSAFENLMTAIWANGKGLPNDLASQFIPVGTSGTGNQVGASNSTVTPISASQKLSDYQAAIAAVQAYETALQSAAATDASSGLSSFSGSIVKVTQNLGWASAGTFYSTISQLYSNVSGMAHAGMPTFSQGNLEDLDDDQKQGITEAISLPVALMNSSNPATFLAGTDTNTSSVNTDDTSSSAINGGGPAPLPNLTPNGNPTDLESASEKIMAGPLRGVNNWLINDFSLSYTNPIGDIIAEGNTMLVSGEAMLATLAVANSFIASGFTAAGEAITGNLGGAGATLTGTFLAHLFPGIVSMFITLAEILIAVGIIESVILPMLIYVTWLYAVLNVIAFAAEFILAAPLAAFQHMRFDGQGFIEQEQRPFYTLLFNGLLRPSLLLFGLFISMFVLSAILNVFNQTFVLGISATQGDQFIGGLQTIGLVVLQVIIQYQVFTRCVSLIHRVPQMVGQLLGTDVPTLSGEDDGRNLIVGAAQTIRGGTGRQVAAIAAPKKPMDQPRSLPKGPQTETPDTQGQ